VPRFKTTSIACVFLFVALSLPPWNLFRQFLAFANARTAFGAVVHFVFVIAIYGSKLFVAGLAQRSHADIYRQNLNQGTATGRSFASSNKYQ